MIFFLVILHLTTYTCLSLFLSDYLVSPININAGDEVVLEYFSRFFNVHLFVYSTYSDDGPLQFPHFYDR